MRAPEGAVHLAQGRLDPRSRVCLAYRHARIELPQVLQGVGLFAGGRSLVINFTDMRLD